MQKKVNCQTLEEPRKNLTPRVLHFSTQHVCFREKSSCENWRNKINVDPGAVLAIKLGKHEIFSNRE
uniref:Uncharacterized protein n=1 Tax=Romanomermis culicivorax TaxID=13658 RepID=A0A915L7M6_ROMCU